VLGPVVAEEVVAPNRALQARLPLPARPVEPAHLARLPLPARPVHPAHLVRQRCRVLS
jgi:hypothetical protein